MTLRSLLLIVAMLGSNAFADEDAVRLYAAGSLRAAMTDVGKAFKTNTTVGVTPVFGASGLLRERIEKGEPAEVFASADVGNALALAKAGRASSPMVFTRNRLCAIAAPAIEVETDTLLDRMLDAGTRLSTLTPKADPGGDYAWLLFEKADKVRPGAYKALDAKALKLTGGPDSPPPQANRSVYSLMIAERKADIFLTYCTNALQTVREVPGARMIAVPDSLAVGADYALVTLNEARPVARRFAEFILSPEAQRILERHGFEAVAKR